MFNNGEKLPQTYDEIKNNKGRRNLGREDDSRVLGAQGAMDKRVPTGGRSRREPGRQIHEDWRPDSGT